MKLPGPFKCSAIVPGENGVNHVCQAEAHNVSATYPNPDEWDGHAFCEAHKGSEEGVTTIEEGEAIYHDLMNINRSGFLN